MHLLAICGSIFSFNLWLIKWYIMAKTYEYAFKACYVRSHGPIPYAPTDMSFSSRLWYYCYSRRTWEFFWGFLASLCLQDIWNALDAWDWTLIRPVWCDLIGRCVLVGCLAGFLTRMEIRGDLFDKEGDDDLCSLPFPKQASMPRMKVSLPLLLIARLSNI